MILKIVCQTCDETLSIGEPGGDTHYTICEACSKKARGSEPHGRCRDEADVIEAANAANDALVAFQRRCPCLPPACCDLCNQADDARNKLAEFLK